MEQRDIVKKMTPAQRLQVADKMYRDAKQLKRAALAQQHPDWSAEKVDDQLKELFLSGTA